MDIIKILGVGLISLAIIIIIKQYKPEFAVYISLMAGVLIILLIVDKLTGIVNLLTALADKTSINKEFLKILLKVTGISILTEFAVSICKDLGESSIANKVDLGGKIIIISISIPIISSLLENVVEILP